MLDYTHKQQLLLKLEGCFFDRAERHSRKQFYSIYVQKLQTILGLKIDQSPKTRFHSFGKVTELVFYKLQNEQDCWTFSEQTQTLIMLHAIGFHVHHTTKKLQRYQSTFFKIYLAKKNNVSQKFIFVKFNQIW